MKFLFDLGGVFFDWDPKFFFTKIISDKDEMDFFLTKVCNDDWNLAKDSGRSIEDGEKDIIKKFPEYENLIRQYYPNHRKMIKGTFQSSVDILMKLKQNNYECFVLSNWSAETYEGMEETYPFLKDFDGKIISGRDFLIKPDPAIYELAISRFDLIPQETLFIDDRLDNIEAAQNLNFQTIHLTDPSLIQDLIDPYIN